MALDPLQTAQNNWQRRSIVFRNAGIADSSWSELYKRDIGSVSRGSQPMSDAEIYAGVQSAVRGPQIQDPTNPHGGHGWFSNVSDFVGNVGRDIKEIVLGAPGGIAHMIKGFPMMEVNSAELLGHLATGDNTWLHNKGYLQPGDNLHESWGDWATILRAMDANGSKQVLPYLPFISDLAKMTTGQGRIALQQHPVSSFLDVLPGIANAGKLAMIGRDFGYIDRVTGKLMKVNGQDARALQVKLKAGGITQGQYAQAIKDAATVWPFDKAEPRLWAAGRALKAGNPVKALVSATGDLIPGGTIDEGLTKITARQRVNVIAKANGFDAAFRKRFLAPLYTLEDEKRMEFQDYFDKYFGKKTVWAHANADDVAEAMKVAGDVNPTTGEVFRSTEEKNNWIENHYTAEQKGGLDNMYDAVDAIHAKAVANKWRVGVNYTNFVKKISKLTPSADIIYNMPATGKVGKAWTKREAIAAKFQNARDRLNAAPENSAESDAAYAEQVRYGKELAAADKALYRAQLVEYPDEWQLYMRTSVMGDLEAGYKRLAEDPKSLMDAARLDEVLKELRSSNRQDQIERLVGKQAYAMVERSAIQGWAKLAAEGEAPLWQRAVDQNVWNRIHYHEPLDISKIHKAPSPHQPRALGIYFGDSVHDIVAVVADAALQTMRHEFATSFIHDYILPRSFTKAAKMAEYQDAVQRAKDAGAKNIPNADRLFKDNFLPFPGAKDLELPGLENVKDLVIDKDLDKFIRSLTNKHTWRQSMGAQVVIKGHSLYKFAVLTGVRHFVHVAFGGMAFLMLSDPLAPIHMFRAFQIVRAASKGDPSAWAQANLPGRTLGGLKQSPYQIGREAKGPGVSINLPQTHAYQVGSTAGEMWLTEMWHQVKQTGAKAFEYIPNKLAQLEEFFITMYKVTAMLSATRRGYDAASAIEEANKLFVDINALSPMERTVVKQIFPFYAFTRHLFRYLMNYPVDHPLKAAIVSQFAEGEQEDWKSGLPRSFNTLFFLGHTNHEGNITAFDLKNVNPFRSFANDFSWAGFTSSLSPFLTMPLNAIGLDTLSGTTQLYPGTYYDPESGSIKATSPPGWQYGVMEGFIPQLGLLDHFFKLTKTTQLMARYDPTAYRKQLWNMLNMPFMPEVHNIPYEKEITEMRRFRQAQAGVTAVEHNPSPQNIANLMRWNAVPFDNTIIAPGPLAQYWKRVAEVSQGIAPSAVVRKPPHRKAQFAQFDITGQQGGGGG